MRQSLALPLSLLISGLMPKALAWTLVPIRVVEELDYSAPGDE